jgi:hypothetical protein
LGTFQRFLKLCAGRTGQLLNLSSLANDCGITHNTAKAWISVLEASYIVHLLPPHHQNFNKRLVKTPKLYFLDTGLATWLLGIQNSEQLPTHVQRGALFELLTDAIGEQGLKPTAKGNLPRNFCREAALSYWGEQGYQENTRFGGINREEDFADLHITRLVAELAGLIRKYKGRFILSRDCRRLLANGGLAAIYPRLFRAYVEQFNWGYTDGYPELRFIQSAFLFTLYLLMRYGDTWMPQIFYEDAFIRAFPMLLDEVPPSQVFSPDDEVRRCYVWRTLVHFAGFLGLATVEPVSDEFLCHEYRVKALPLLGQFVQFQLPK